MKTKTDLYTRIVLTVIAVALVGHLIKDIDLVSKAQASEPPTSPSVEKREVIDVNIVQVAGRDVSRNSLDAIPVNVRNTVDVSH